MPLDLAPPVAFLPADEQSLLQPAAAAYYFFETSNLLEEELLLLSTAVEELRLEQEGLAQTMTKTAADALAYYAEPQNDFWQGVVLVADIPLKIVELVVVVHDTDVPKDEDQEQLDDEELPQVLLHADAAVAQAVPY